MKHKTADLSGDLLDLAVALADGYQWLPGRTIAAQDDAKTVRRSHARHTYGQLVVHPAPAGEPGRPYALEMLGGTSTIFGLARTAWAPSSDWSIGGPIIERERVDLLHLPSRNVWEAAPASSDAGFGWSSPTPLVAAMRAFVADKLGPEVDLPDDA